MMQHGVFAGVLPLCVKMRFLLYFERQMDGE